MFASESKVALNSWSPRGRRVSPISPMRRPVSPMSRPVSPMSRPVSPRSPWSWLDDDKFFYGFNGDSPRYHTHPRLTDSPVLGEPACVATSQPDFGSIGSLFEGGGVIHDEVQSILDKRLSSSDSESFIALKDKNQVKDNKEQVKDNKEKCCICGYSAEGFHFIIGKPACKEHHLTLCCSDCRKFKKHPQITKEGEICLECRLRRNEMSEFIELLLTPSDDDESNGDEPDQSEENNLGLPLTPQSKHIKE